MTDSKKQPKLTDKAKKKLTFALLGIFTLVMAVILIIELSYKDSFTSTTYSMGTYVSQTIYGGDGVDVAGEVANAIAVLEDEISWKLEDSYIYEINSNAGEAWTYVPLNVYKILKQGQELSQVTDGAFDFTIAPLSILWGFDDEPTTPPEDEVIQNLLEYVDYDALRFDDETYGLSFIDSGYCIDLGSLGKGAACDVAVEMYEELDVDYALVIVGGTVGIYGTKPFGELWQIAVRDPEGDGSVGVLSLDSGFISTSGSYEKTFQYEGQEYHHILDPDTGYPVENNLVSVTVVCDNGTISDGLSTALFVLGYEDSLAVLEYYGAEAVFIFDDNSVIVTEGLEDSFQITSEDYYLTNGYLG